jgi:hypothetical protein
MHLLSTEQALVDEVMDWFNFTRVHAMMECVQFGWVASLDSFEEADLRVWVRQFILRSYKQWVLAEREPLCIETGGFRVKWEMIGDNPYLCVEAIIASWSSGD